MHFLQAAWNCPVLRDPRRLKRSLHRYETLWLPWMARLQDRGDFSEAAPLDMAWLWHCHMLDPVEYNEYCDTHFGRLVFRHREYATAVELDEMERLWNKEMERLWKKEHQDTLSEPFDLVALKATSSNLPQTTTKDQNWKGGANGRQRPPTDPTPLTELLADAIPKQVTFLYQVMRPHFHCRQFLEIAVQRYYNFLLLKRDNPDLTLFPTSDIELMWQAHRCVPQRYMEDMEALLGNALTHQDSFSDRSSRTRSQLSPSNETALRWREAYGVDYWLPGAMYRGEPPPFLPRSVQLDRILRRAAAYAVRHHITAVTLTTEMEERPQKVTLLQGRQKQEVMLTRNATDPFRQQTDCKVTLQVTQVQPETHRLGVGLRRDCILRPKRFTTLVLEATPSAFANPVAPLVVELRGARLEMERWIEAQENVWVFDLLRRPFRPVDLSSPTPLAALMATDQCPDGTPPLPKLVRMPGGRQRSVPPQVTGALHPVQGIRHNGGAILLWCNVIHSQDADSGAQLTFLQLLDDFGQAVGTARTSCRMEWPARPLPGCPAAVGPDDRSVVVSCDGKDWMLICGIWYGMRLGVPEKPGSPATVGRAGELRLVIIPLQGLQDMTEPGQSYKLVRTSAGVWSLLQYPGESMIVTVNLSTGRVYINCAMEGPKALAMLLAAFAVGLLRNLCWSAAAHRAEARLTDSERALRAASAPDAAVDVPSGFADAFGTCAMHRPCRPGSLAPTVFPERTLVDRG